MSAPPRADHFIKGLIPYPLPMGSGCSTGERKIPDRFTTAIARQESGVGTNCGQMLSSLDSLQADFERCRQRQQKALRRYQEARSQIDRIKVFLVNNPGSVRPLQPQIESALDQLHDARFSWAAAIMTEDKLRQLLRMPPREPRNYVLERERVHAA